MLFKYKAIESSGSKKEGSIDAINMDVAIASLQRRGLIISSIDPAIKRSAFNIEITMFQKVSNKDLVILLRQISTLFKAQVSALRVFRLLADENENPLLQKTLVRIADDLQGGMNISGALAKHPKIFSAFIVNMVMSGEESGKLEQIFENLADYLDRTYAVVTKARNALFYPAFVVGTFVVVMILMLTMVIPRLSTILIESGQEIPLYTKIVIAMSDVLINYGFLILAGLIIGGFFVWRYSQSGEGRIFFAELKTTLPILGKLYDQLYLSRIADNLSTMLTSGIPMVRSIELTGKVVGNKLYEELLMDVANAVKGGSSVSAALSKHEKIPGIMVQMIKVGEETGELGNILNTMALFYRREVNNSVDTLVGLIEPMMIVLLGLGVGTLLASVLIPIYSVSTSF